MASYQKTFLALMLSAALAAPAANAEWRTHAGANVRFDVPAGWSMQPHGRNVLVVVPPGGGLGVEMVALTNPATNALIEAELMVIVRAQFQQARVTQPARPLTQNGLSGVGVRGVGVRDGHPMEWFALAVGANGHGIAAIGFAQPGQLDGNVALRHLLDSIQPAA